MDGGECRNAIPTQWTKGLLVATAQNYTKNFIYANKNEKNGIKCQTNRRRKRGYTRIEPEAGGAALAAKPE